MSNNIAQTENGSSNNATNHQGRREFLKASAAAGVVPYFAWTQPSFENRSKNDRPSIGCIGLGGIGQHDAHQHSRFGDIVALCDVDSDHLERAFQSPKIGNGKGDKYTDYRKLLERNDIDVVSISTPDHWHVKIAVEALQAGKHVFCQKPLTLTIAENQLIRSACEKYDKQIFTVGTQQRSNAPLFLRAVNLVRKNLIGDIRKITIGVGGGETGGPFKPSPVPKNLDWDKWLGPAPEAEYIKERTHRNFRWWYEYSGGKLTDWGAHHVDIASWATGMDLRGEGPQTIDGTDTTHPVEFKDGYPVDNSSYNTCTDFNIVCKFANGLEMHITNRSDNGILFEGEDGRIFVNRERLTGAPIEDKVDEGAFGPSARQVLFKGKPVEPHKNNFFRCIREGGLPVSDVFSHTQILHTCHLAGIAARLGKVIQWDPQEEKIVGDKLAAAFASRLQRSGYKLPTLDS